MNPKPKILLAMSGGIDSSVAALLLQSQGWEVYGLTLRMWDYLLSDCKAKEFGCCSIESINDAKTFSETYNIQHYVLDCREDFLKEVADNFNAEYLAGRTPNPCVVCNSRIKWRFLIEMADKIGCYYVATGHYANIFSKNNRYYISKAKDYFKDQSYFLWQLTQDELKRTIFPLGNLTKNEIKGYAEKNKLETLCNKKESMEICFIQSGDYRDFLQKYNSNFNDIINEGDFIDKNGNVLGRHKGYSFYTIGQRKGLGIAADRALYVTNIFPQKNLVELGYREELISYSLNACCVNFMKYDSLPENNIFNVKIRYQDKGKNANLYFNNNILHINFLEAVEAITPGQSVVAYCENDIVLGGIIL